MERHREFLLGLTSSGPFENGAPDETVRVWLGRLKVSAMNSNHSQGCGKAMREQWNRLLVNNFEAMFEMDKHVVVQVQVAFAKDIYDILDFTIGFTHIK